jgi:hypothetical protein
VTWTKPFAMAVLLAGSCCLGQTSPRGTTEAVPTVEPGYSITVLPPADLIAVGSPIKITVVVKNIGAKEIPWRAEFLDTPYRAFHFLLSHDGHEVDTTPFHRRMRGEQRPDDPPLVESGSSVVSSVTPGKSFTYTIDLKRLYQIADPGRYSLDVSRVDDENKTVVRAKPLFLEIASR